jgi:hypothetical protein
MLASCGVNFPIRLDPFHNEFQDLGAECVCFVLHQFQFFNMMCMYEPEVFPGVIFSMKEPKVTVLIFVSGRFAPPSPPPLLLHSHVPPPSICSVIFTGAKSHEDLNSAFENMYCPSLCYDHCICSSHNTPHSNMYPLLLKFRKHSL